MLCKSIHVRGAYYFHLMIYTLHKHHVSIPPISYLKTRKYHSRAPWCFLTAPRFENSLFYNLSTTSIEHTQRNSPSRLIHLYRLSNILLVRVLFLSPTKAWNRILRTLMIQPRDYSVSKGKFLFQYAHNSHTWNSPFYFSKCSSLIVTQCIIFVRTVLRGQFNLNFIEALINDGACAILWKVKSGVKSCRISSFY